jgi:hypothetical protein
MCWHCLSVIFCHIYVETVPKETFTASVFCAKGMFAFYCQAAHIKQSYKRGAGRETENKIKNKIKSSMALQKLHHYFTFHCQENVIYNTLKLYQSI